MQKSSDPKEKISPRARQRFLNIIYFVDSHRTRTLKFTIRTAALSLGTFVALIGWSFMASGLLYREHAINSELLIRNRQLLTSIFNYQTRYDQVYEHAYPTESQAESFRQLASETSSNSEAQLEKEAENAITSKEVLPPTPTQAVTAGELKPAVETPKEASISKVKASTSAKVDIPIQIENFASDIQDQNLMVRFALRNLATPSKTSGTVSVRAQYITNSQTESFVNPNSEESDSESGSEGADPSSDRHFNIRYYKNKAFRFDPPADAAGTFKRILVSISDEQGRTKDFSFPIVQGESEGPKQAAAIGEDPPESEPEPEPEPEAK